MDKKYTVVQMMLANCGVQHFVENEQVSKKMEYWDREAKLDGTCAKNNRAITYLFEHHKKDVDVGLGINEIKNAFKVTSRKLRRDIRSDNCLSDSQMKAKLDGCSQRYLNKLIEFLEEGK